jgi:beta-phosphoglucomutase-like phosphatase (HAD superfamily)
LFDFDGVFIKTAKVHAAAARKEMFDAHPREQAARSGERFRFNGPGSRRRQTLRRRVC